MATFDNNFPIGRNVRVMKLFFSFNEMKEVIKLPELEGKRILSIDTDAANKYMLVIVYQDC